MNRALRRAVAADQVKEAKRITYERQQIIRAEKEEFLKQSYWGRLETFYQCIPSKKGRRTFWILSPLVFLLFLPLQALIAASKIDVAWTWSKQILYSFINGK